VFCPVPSLNEHGLHMTADSPHLHRYIRQVSDAIEFNVLTLNSGLLSNTYSTFSPYELRPGLHHKYILST
jgi:hypothetical protein